MCTLWDIPAVEWICKEHDQAKEAKHKKVCRIPFTEIIGKRKLSAQEQIRVAIGSKVEGINYKNFSANGNVICLGCDGSRTSVYIFRTKTMYLKLINFQFSSVQSLICVQLFVTPWTAVCQASLPITNSWNLLKLMSIESVMPSNHLILCHPFLLPPSTFPSIRVFSNESALCIRWPKYWSFSFKISPSNEYSGLISFRMDWLDLLAV